MFWPIAPPAPWPPNSFPPIGPEAPTTRYLITGVGLLHVIRHLLESCEPDPGLRLHVGDQLIELRDARAVAGDVGMHGEDKQGAFLIGSVELGLVNLVH